MKMLLGRIFKVVLVVYVFMFAYEWWQPTPDALNRVYVTHLIPETSVHFFADTTGIDKKGARVTDQHIWDEIFAAIDRSKKMILLDMFLFNDAQGPKPETERLLSRELTEHLLQKNTGKNHTAIAFVSDPINTVYGGMESPYFERLKRGGVFPIITDLRSLPDSNLAWSAFWRPFISWWGNSNKNGIFPNPFQFGGQPVTLRSWMALLNFKANHRKLVVADEPFVMKGGKEGQRMITIITSANPHDASSAHGNVALKIDDGVWVDAIESENAIAQLSDNPLPTFNIGDVDDAAGDLKATLLQQKNIKTRTIEILRNMKKGDHAEIAMFYLSERTIIDEIVAAANRGASIRVILDPNKDAFGFTKNGIPNRPVAKELRNRSLESINIRWCDTHGEQCHAKLFMGQTASSTFLMLGSANFTRRNIDGYNLEVDVLIEGDPSKPFPAWNDAEKYFNDLWSNNGEIYTADYAKYEDLTIWKTQLYRMMERTGMSSF